MNADALAGFLLFLGAVQFLVLMILAETQYPNYSPAANYISDLGLWKNRSAWIFNPSIILLGGMTVTAGALLWSMHGPSVGPILVTLSGIGAFGVGIVNEKYLKPHLVFALLAFAPSALAAVSYGMGTPLPFGAASVILGLISLSALVLIAMRRTLGLGMGGMERMVFYPVLGWMLAYSGYLMASP
jgi:hypothetical membrane protein